MAADPWSIGLQALGILKGGSGPANATSSTAGSFAGQTIVFGNPAIPPWNPAVGGSGPGEAFSFTQPGADAFVMGMTGLNTATGFAAGNGMQVQNQPTQPQGALGPSWAVIGMVAAAAVAAILLLK